jgi:hypothetical protein
MPQIREYTSPVDSLHPTEGGINARLQEARRTGTFYREAAGELSSAARAQVTAADDMTRAVGGIAGGVTEAAKLYEDYAGHKEVSKGAAASAQLFSDLTEQWDATVKKADPNDPAVAAKFRETVLEPKLQEFSGAYSQTGHGQRWTESHVATMRQHFFQKTAADMSTLAGEAVVVNGRQLANASSNTALRSPDFHTVDYLLGQVDGSVAAIVDSSPNLKGAGASRARTQLVEQISEKIVKSGALGAIQKSADPEQTAKDYAARYPKYVNGEEAQQFAKAATYYKRLNDSEGRAARVQADYESKVDFNKKINALEVATMPENAGDPPRLPNDYWAKLRELSTHPGAALEPGRLKTMVTNGETITARLDKPEPLARVSHAATVQLLNDIRDGKITDTKPIYDRFGKGDLSNGDMNFVLKAFTDMRSPEGQRLSQGVSELVKAVKPSIDKSNPIMGRLDQDGPLNLYRFEVDLNRKIAEYRKANKDPHDLLDPSKPDFFGRPETLQSYQKPLTQSAADTARRLTGRPSVNLTGDGSVVTGVETTNIPPKAPPRNPGESADAYLARIGKK